MFTRLLYLNKDRVLEYYSLLSNEDYSELEEIEIVDKQKLGLDAHIFSGGADKQKNYKGKVFASASRLWNTFQEKVENDDAYINFVTGDKSIEYLCRDYIIQIETIIEIPQEYDAVSILNKIPREFIEKQIINDMGDDDKDIALSLFKMGKASLPIFMRYDNKILCSKLSSNYFLCDEEEFEEAIDDELVIAAKVISPHRSKEKEIFNPLKDFMALNRASRRAMEMQNIEGLEDIYAPDDYMDLEVLAIYQ